MSVGWKDDRETEDSTTGPHQGDHEQSERVVGERLDSHVVEPAVGEPGVGHGITCVAQETYGHGLASLFTATPLKSSGSRRELSKERAGARFIGGAYGSHLTADPAVDPLDPVPVIAAQAQSAAIESTYRGHLPKRLSLRSHYRPRLTVLRATRPFDRSGL